MSLRWAELWSDYDCGAGSDDDDDDYDDDDDDDDDDGSADLQVWQDLRDPDPVGEWTLSFGTNGSGAGI